MARIDAAHFRRPDIDLPVPELRSGRHVHTGAANHGDIADVQLPDPPAERPRLQRLSYDHRSVAVANDGDVRMGSHTAEHFEIGHESSRTDRRPTRCSPFQQSANAQVRRAVAEPRHDRDMRVPGAHRRGEVEAFHPGVPVVVVQ